MASYLMCIVYKMSGVPTAHNAHVSGAFASCPANAGTEVKTAELEPPGQVGLSKCSSFKIRVERRPGPWLETAGFHVACSTLLARHVARRVELKGCARSHLDR